MDSIDHNDHNDRNHHDDHIVSTDTSVHHAGHPTAGEEVGEAAGGITGVVTGAAIGSVAGPVGTVIGGIAGAIGGWWAGRAVADAATSFTHTDDEFYRDHYEASDTRLADRRYDDVRPAYQLGHIAARNPDYAGRPFESVESDLRRGWDSTASTTHGEWERVRGYARDAYARNAAPRGETAAREDAENAAEDADKRIDDTMGVQEF